MDEKVVEIIADKLGYDVSELSMNLSLTKDLGADSLDEVETIMELEKVFDITIPDNYLSSNVTVGELIHLVRTRRDSKNLQAPAPKKTVKKRVIKITEYTYDDGTVLMKPVVRGFNDFELIGILDYFRDNFKIVMLRGNK